MAYCAVTFLFHRLSRLMDEEPHFFRGVEVQAESIRNELSWMMKKCVEYIDKERDEHKSVEQYRRQIRDIIFDVEDAIDMLILKGATAKRRQIEVVIKAKMFDDVVKKIKGIKVGIEEIATNIEKFGIEDGAASHVDPTAEETRQRRKRDVEEDDVVGFVKHFAALADRLTKWIPNLGVIPIVGMSGIGKTTIARKLFNSDCIKTHFKCRVWVPLSRFSAAEEVLLNILEEMPITLELGRTLMKKTAKESLRKKLSTYLLEKRYLVVLDGIRNRFLWEEVRSAFPDTLNGSRILITTTQIHDVPARFGYSYSLPLLNKDESCELFHKKVFRGVECPPVLETLGKQAIEYCKGLPFAIVVLGSYLANTEKTYEAWSKVLAEINLSLPGEKAWAQILKLSYTHMPQHLKPCILHLEKKYEDGIEILVEFLIQEWISLGFIEQSGERNTVDVAKDYFKELVDRSLIQVVSRRSDGEATICSIHDLVRKLCISEHFNESTAILASGIVTRASIQVNSSRFVKSEVVTITKQLIEGNSKLDVISITGVGGLGKTTLAREIYNNDAIKSRFNCRVWMSVSQNLRTRELLLQILKCQIPKSDDLIRSLEDMSRDELKKKLLEYLRGKRYLIVMDDVWITEIWDEIRSAFPDDFNGSRILITSCIQEVASHTSLNPPYSLPFIEEDKSWNLFREKVFRGRNREEFPADLEAYPEIFLTRLGRQIAQGCLGIPLSIVVLCGILANKGMTHRIWSKVIADVNWYPAQAATLRDDILNLSYTHLPRHLKPCFLYLGAYPKDFEIPARQLIQLWIAEGLINCGGNEDIEDVAENHLKELIDRNLIQVVERRSDGGSKTYHVHDLVRDLCISEGVEEKFFDVSENVNLSSWKKSRRLSIQGSTLDLYMSSNTPSLSIARSLLFFDEDTYGGFDPNHWKWVEENFNLLRVLNFGNLNVYSIPTWIKRLIHLRYLRVQSDALKVIPASIGNLTNLETLDLRGTFLNSLPIGIWKLRNLRNLYMSGPVSLPNQSDTKIEALSNLQVLSTVSLDAQTFRPIVAKLPNVRKLGIWFASNESNSEAGHALGSLQHLHRLRKLKIINCSGIHSLPNSFPETIRKITLRQVCLEGGDWMKVLGNLVNLQILKLQSCLLSSQLNIHGDSFPALRFLKLENLRIEEWKCESCAMRELSKLENLRIEEWKCGSCAMRELRHLVIDRCYELTRLPSCFPYFLEVEVLESNLIAAKFFENLVFNLLIDPPLDADFYEDRRDKFTN